MWCPSCRRDVPAAGGEDGDGTCVSCGGPATDARPPAADPSGDEAPAARRARELLDRWSHLFEEGGADRLAADYERAEPRVAAKSASSPAVPAAEPQPQPVPDAKPRAAPVAVMERPKRVKKPRTQPPQWRMDAAHGTPAEAAAGRTADVPPPHRVPTSAPRVHAGHAPGPSAPHFDPVAAGTFGGGPARTSGPLGQLLAYGGVLGLTVGGAFVVWSYFGGPPGYAPTGWLLTTAGQMLLFLGIVTLIAGGMERTTHEVRTRIETLSGGLHRIEQAQKQAMKAPHIAPEAFAAGVPADAAKSRETVAA